AETVIGVDEHWYAVAFLQIAQITRGHTPAVFVIMLICQPLDCQMHFLVDHGLTGRNGIHARRQRPQCGDQCFAIPPHRPALHSARLADARLRGQRPDWTHWIRCEAPTAAVRRPMSRHPAAPASVSIHPTVDGLPTTW